MFDLFLTLALVYVVYRGYGWYNRLQEQVKAGSKKPPFVDKQPPSNKRAEEDYIDYEEVE